LTIAVGAAFVADSVTRDSSFHNLPIFICYFALALLTSAWKVRLPGITGTISVNFLFVLVATALFSFSETVILASAASIVQSFWKARRPKMLQVAFNVATLAISSGIAYRAAHAITDRRANSALVLLPPGNVLLRHQQHTAGIRSPGARRYETTTERLEAVLPVVVPVLPDRRIHCRSGRSLRQHHGRAAVPLLIAPLMLMVHIFYRTCVAHVVNS